MNDLFKTIDTLIAPEQLRYWEGVQWLTYEGMRGSGRTHLLALAFIKEAIKSPVPVRVWDHYKPYSNNTAMLHNLFGEIDKCVREINERMKYTGKLICNLHIQSRCIQIHFELPDSYRVHHKI
jgi:hypothetical protein